MTAPVVPERIQLRRTLGWRLPPNTAVVSRPSKWGNPFGLRQPFGRDDPLRRYLEQGLAACGIMLDLDPPVHDLLYPVTRPVAVAAFRAWLPSQVGRSGFALTEEARAELRGKNLACWCPLPADGEPDICHAAVLLAISNTGESKR